MSLKINELSNIKNLIEEQNELLNENNQLLGEILNKLDEILNFSRLSSKDKENFVEHSSVPVKQIKNCNLKTKYSIHDVDQNCLNLAINDDSLSREKVVVIKPTGKAREGWLRTIIQYPDMETLVNRMKKGCLCNKRLITRKIGEEEFWTCEGVAQGTCDFRPGIQLEKNQFLINIPPKQ
jgi:hypothetical protein